MEKDLCENYIEEIRRYPLLSFEEETALSERIEKGDQKALMELVQSNLRLVVSIAKKFNTVKISIMDLIQEGNIGLMTAASKYHYSFKTRFSTYAYSWIMQYMLRYLHNKCSTIALPHRKDDMVRRLSSVRCYLFQQTGRDPTDEEIASYLGIPVERISETDGYSFSMMSLDSEYGDDNSMSVADMIPDTTYAPETSLMNEANKKEIRDLMAGLPEKEQQVIYERYNFSGEQHVQTLREISSKLGVSAETVRQMEIRAIRRMRKAAEKAASENKSDRCMHV